MRPELKAAAERALRSGVNLRKGETLLIVTDRLLRLIGEAFWEAALDMGNETVFLEMLPRKTSGEEPPAPVVQAMASADVVVAPTSASLTHTKARREACKAGARVATMPGITEDTMVRCLAADLEKIAKRTLAVTKELDGRDRVRVTSPSGTDITFSIKGVKPIASTGLIHNRGEFGNLPSGESYMMPVEGSAQGIISVDGSMAGIGSLLGKTPILIEVEEGMAVRIRGGREAEELTKKLDACGGLARNIAEFGIGTNHAARITGNILEDEKVMGTIHIALGNNLSMGGTVDVPLHLDGLVLRPTVEIDGTVLMREGKIELLPA
jgi:leucyl aminopeptidase (aminopeptidase T)